MATEGRGKSTRFIGPVAGPGCPGSIPGRAEDVTRWLFVQRCLVRKAEAWSSLHCNSIASFPGSCIIGNAAKSKRGGSKLEPGSAKLIYGGVGAGVPANSDFSRPLSPPPTTANACSAHVGSPLEAPVCSNAQTTIWSSVTHCSRFNEQNP